MAPVPVPVGLRQLWSIVSALGLGVVVCLLGLLLTDPTENAWAIAAYAVGLASAVLAAIAAGQLAARRRRVVVEAELAVAELQRAVGQLSYIESPKTRRREFGRLEVRAERAGAYHSALLGAEAYEQARELDQAIAAAQRLLIHGEAPR